MCRLFGFKSVLKSGVHSSLLSADNALLSQSQHHPDGWGVAYYHNAIPHLVKSADSAMTCSIFKKVSGAVSSNTVLAHIRKATKGAKTILNTHPFQYGKWIFAHNGNIKNFEQIKDKLRGLVHEKLRPFIMGDTDSEHLFYLIIGQLLEDECLEQEANNDQISSSLKKAINKIIAIAGEPHHDPDGPDTESYYSFLITNGSNMVAYHGGKDLYFSTYKTKCSERDLCPKFSPECENPTKNAMVNHLLFSSEPLSGENVWEKMKMGEIIAIDSNMVFKHYF